MRELNYASVNSTASSRTPTLVKCYVKQRFGLLLFRRFFVRSDGEERVESGQETTASVQKVAGGKHAASY